MEHKNDQPKTETMQCINTLAETAHFWLDETTNKVKILEHQMERVVEKTFSSMSEVKGKLADRIFFLEVSLHVIQIISEHENTKNMESFVV